MKKIKIKVPAKVNLTLDIVGVENGYHTLNSLISSINIYDAVTLTKRKDKQVTIKCLGIPAEIEDEKNNAYLTAVRCVSEFNTAGVDIVLDKQIPVGAGLGGSSADIVAVLKGFQKLFALEAKKINELASKLGSDVLAMMHTGYTIIKGVGDIAHPLSIKYKFFFIFLADKTLVSSKQSYSAYDKLGVTYKGCTDRAISYLTNGEKQEFISIIKNDLTPASISLAPKIQSSIDVLSKHGKAVMTGSGSFVYAIFPTKKAREEAFKALLPIAKDKLIKANTI